MVKTIFFFFLFSATLLMSSDNHRTLVDDIKEANQVADFDVDNLRHQDVKSIVVDHNSKIFRVETRKDKMTIQNCQACHEKPIPEVNKNAFDRKSHWEIIRPHGNAKNLNCTTCHQSDNLNRLKVGNNQSVDFDQAFQSCATCHFQQVKDWSGGAHGKRLVGWAGPKIIQNCASCHDPHSPKFKIKRPAIMSPSYDTGN